MKMIQTIALALISISAQAGVLNTVEGTKVVADLKVSASAAASVQGRSYNLATVGAGLRSKFLISVYVGELLVSDKEKFSCDMNGALGSLDSMKAAAINMRFKTGVGIDKIVNAFQEGFDANGVDMNKQAIKDFLAAVKAGGDAVKGKTFVIVGEKLEGGKEAITWENSADKATTVVGEAGFVKSVFSIWLGEAEPTGLENVKKGMICFQK